MGECGAIDHLSGAVCTVEQDHTGNHVDASVDGISISWPSVELNLNNNIIFTSSTVSLFDFIEEETP
jgi:hypothetical protein